MERFYNILDAVEQVATSHNVSAARVSRAWLLAKPHVTSIIIGAKNMEQLNDNMASADLALSMQEVEKLDQASDLPPEYPGWMLSHMLQDRFHKAPFTPKPPAQPASSKLYRWRKLSLSPLMTQRHNSR